MPPLLVSAQVCTRPAVMATAGPGRFTTATGVLESDVDSFPSWPRGLDPQHRPPPPVRSAHAWRRPTAMETAPVARPLTGTGRFEVVFVPLPSCPDTLS